jgi:hypothetical protein
MANGSSLAVPVDFADDAPDVADDLPAILFVNADDAHSWHGPGLLVALGTPLVFGPENPHDADALVDELNQVENADPTTESVFTTRTPGSWWASKDGQIWYSTFLSHRMLASVLGDGRRGPASHALYRLVDRVAGDRVDQLSRLAVEHGMRSDGPPSTWAGTREAHAFTAIARLSGGAPLIQLANRLSAGTPPTHSEPELAVVWPTLLLAAWGIFNPVGPTLTSLGLTVVPDGRILLCEWMRHPSGPQYRAHAVLADMELATIERALRELMVDTFGAQDFDRCPVPSCLPEFVLPVGQSHRSDLVRELLREIAERFVDPRQLIADANEYRYFAGDAWARMSGNRVPAPDDGLEPGQATSAQAADYWWQAVTDPPHVNGHVNHFPQAWDGSQLFLQKSHDPNRPWWPGSEFYQHLWDSM